MWTNLQHGESEYEFRILALQMQGHDVHAGQSETSVKALTCLQAWLGLGLRDSAGGTISSPGGLYDYQVTTYTTRASAVSIQSSSWACIARQAVWTEIDLSLCQLVRT